MSEYSTSVAIGGLGIRVRYPAGLAGLSFPLVKPFIAPNFSGFHDLEVDLVARPIEKEWLDRKSESKILLDTRSTWALADLDHPEWKYHFGPSPANLMDPPSLHMLANSNFTRSRVYYDVPKDEPLAGVYPLEEVFIRHALVFQRGLLVHASGLEIEGKGYLFLGDSGAGKSTIASLFEEKLGKGRVFSDDRMIVRFANGKWRMYGTPWHGTFPRVMPHGIELGGLCFIEQTPKNEINSLDAWGALSRLLKVYLATWWLPGTTPIQMALANQLLNAEQVAVVRLGFVNTPDAVDFFLKSIDTFHSQNVQRPRFGGEKVQNLN